MIVERLRSLREDDSSGRPEPVPIPLSADAKTVWRRFYNEHAAELAEASGPWASFLAKVEGATPRIALILELASWADDGQANPPDEIGREAMCSAIAIAVWFKHEANRTYNLLDEADEDREHRHLLEWIRRQDGPVTARDVARGMRSIKNTDAAELALTALKDAGLGQWEAVEPGDQGGRPTRVFRLVYDGVSTKSLETRPKQCFVDSRQIDTTKDEVVI